MAPIDSYIHQHPYNAIGALVVLYNIALWMPPPDATDSKWYKWLFSVMHALALLVPRLASNFLPPGSWVYKLFAGGNGATNGAAPNSSTNAPNLSTPPKP